MGKVAVVYWSGTGNTQAMAETVAQASGGALFTAAEFGPEKLAEYEAIAFGCPSMGTEELEDSEFLPMFEAVKDGLADKKVALFGSYGWGDGQWMRDWCKRCDEHGANLYDENGLIANETPDASAQEKCRELGRKLAAW